MWHGHPLPLHKTHQGLQAHPLPLFKAHQDLQIVSELKVWCDIVVQVLQHAVACTEERARKLVRTAVDVHRIAPARHVQVTHMHSGQTLAKCMS